VTLGLLACAALPEPGSLSVLERARQLQARTMGIHTLAAVLAMTFTAAGPPRAFDMIVNYEASNTLRFTALKEIGLSSQPLFDLLLTGEHYRLDTNDATGCQQQQGRRARFVEEHPQFSVLQVVGAAFFLPGVDGDGNLPVFTNRAASRFMTRLTSGARVQWFTRPGSVEIFQAEIDAPVSLMLRYTDYRWVDAHALPGRVTVLAPRLGLTTQARLKQVEINMPLAPGIFALSEPCSMGATTP
jgi:hypothetical protein